MVSELATNVIRHARTTFGVTVQREGETVTVRVLDESPRLPELRRSGPHRTTGRGLAIVGALSHEWGVTRAAGGKVVWASFRIDPSSGRVAEHRSAQPAQSA